MTMIVALEVLAVLAMVIGAVFYGAISLNSTTKRDARSKRALAAAEAGLQVARYRLNRLVPSNPSCLTNQAVAPSFSTGECPSYTGNLGNGVTYTYWVTDTSQGAECGGTTTGETRCITSVGTAGAISRRLQMRVGHDDTQYTFPLAGIMGFDGVHVGNGTSGTPTVINGALTADSILVDGDAVSAIVGWAALAVGDPARDLHWLMTSRGASAELALEAYVIGRSGGADEHLPQRALLYGELELARWLLHGIDQRDRAIVDDAVSLLDGLAASVHDRSSEPLSPETGPIMTVGEVERMLDDTPRGAVPREGGATLLTDSYDFSELERREAGERPAAAMDLTAPIPLDLSDWGDAAPGAGQPTREGADAADGDDGSGAGPASPATDAQERRNAASS